ncbi:MAG: hypothetical protein WD275_09200, partial [Rhodothermales bacterium]
MVAALLSLLILVHFQSPDTIEVDPEMLLREEPNDAESEAALVQEHIHLLATSRLDLNRADE